MRTLLAVTIVALTLHGAATECPDGYEGHVDNCYKLLPVKVAWGEAQRYCMSVGGSLAVINNQAENTFIDNMLTRIKAEIQTSAIWIGGNDLLQEGTFVAPDTLEPLTYFNWAPGQPDNSHGEHCLALFNTPGFAWDDLWCERQMNPLCKRPKMETDNIIG